MSQKTINVGTIANDGTGDTIRGAFTNVNANFTEIFNNVSVLTAAVASIDTGQNVAISSAYTTANLGFDQANSANQLAQSLRVSANLYSNAVGAAGNVYAVAIGAAGNSVSTTIGDSANAYSVSIGAAGNAYTVVVGAASNTYANVVGEAGNNYTSLLAANNAVGGNAWANTIATAGNNWTLSTFSTLSNTALVFNTTNAAFDKANTAFQNTSGTLTGNLNITGTATSLGGFYDAIGSVRERFAVTIASANVIANSAHLTYIANSSSTVQINIPDDNVFVLAANIGTTIEIYQFGTGTTRIVANDAAVTVRSANNWANIAGQYLTASALKVSSNTWLLTGDLRA